ncbi:MAG: hypothetical protein Q4B40_04390 [Clostridia bacterium]|nr:hypothetical protein [Clostridia bacterium]
MAFAAGLLFIILIFVYLFLFAYLVFSYVMTSLSLMTIAKRRAVQNPWLAWVPVGNYWVLGAIITEYDGRNGIKRRWDKVLLTLGIIFGACVVIFFIATIIFVVFAIGAQERPSLVGINVGAAAAAGIWFFAAYIALILCSVAVSFIALVCYYKLFESTVPEKALKYFLLSFLCPFAAPICLFLCRNKGYEVPNPYIYQTPPTNIPPQNL